MLHNLRHIWLCILPDRNRQSSNRQKSPCLVLLDLLEKMVHTISKVVGDKIFLSKRSDFREHVDNEVADDTISVVFVFPDRVTDLYFFWVRRSLGGIGKENCNENETSLCLFAINLPV